MQLRWCPWWMPKASPTRVRAQESATSRLTSWLFIEATSWFGQCSPSGPLGASNRKSTVSCQHDLPSQPAIPGTIGTLAVVHNQLSVLASYNTGATHSCLDYHAYHHLPPEHKCPCAPAHCNSTSLPLIGPSPMPGPATLKSTSMAAASTTLSTSSLAWTKTYYWAETS